jgi:hypothetical protein
MIKNARQIEKALFLKRILGTRCAAGYLRNRGYSIDGALWILCRK